MRGVRKMHWFINMFLEAAAGIVFLIPVLVICNLFFFHSWKRTFAYAVFGSYLLYVFCLVGLPSLQYHPFEVNLNLIPFRDMNGAMVTTILNVFMFIPLGFLLPLLWANFRRFSSTLAFCYLASLFIELAQLFTYRATDVDDLITNTLGGCIGYCSARLLTIRRRNQPAQRKNPLDLAILCISCILIMFFLQPLLSPVFYDLFH